ncbi:MAG: MMPL family transporter [Deltaproteobacteria bacterium]|nr:MMPL family transporter [Deltaproteobacteria bacterium]
MPNLRTTVEKRFERLGAWLYDNPVKVLLATFLLVGFFVVQIPSISIDTSSEALLKKEDPSLLEYNRFRDQFGRAELIVIAIQSPEIFSSTFLSKLQSFHQDLEEEIPYLREVTSLINARRTRGERDRLIVKDLLEDWPRDPMDLMRLKKEVLSNPFYLNYLISEDAQVTAIIVETEAAVTDDISPAQDLLDAFDEKITEAPPQQEKPHYFSEKENREVVAAINRVVERHSRDDFPITVSGGPVVVNAFNIATMSDIRRCIVLSLASVALFLGILFRRVSGIILPVIIINAALFSTIGIMSFTGTPIKITTTVIPAFLLSVGVCDSVHVLAIFYRLLDRGQSKKDAIAKALGHSGVPVVMTSLTTAAGVLSFLFADLRAIAEIGIFAAAGVLLALLYTVVLLPPMLALVKIKPKGGLAGRKGTMDRFLESIAVISTSHRKKILLAGCLFFLVFFPAVFLLSFSHNIVAYFPDDSPYKQNLGFIDNRLKGSITLEIVMDTHRENGLHEPEILNRIELFGRQTETFHQDGITVGKVFSITDILKEIHQALNENDSGYYRIPQDRRAVAQEFLLFENSGSDDLERIVDSQFSRTRITIKTPWVDAVVCKKFIDNIQQRLSDQFQDSTSVHATGLMALLARAISAAIYSMAKSYLVAFFAITILMIILIGNWKLGLVSMIPNFLPILMTMGIMGFLNIPLDINSLMIGSIAIGIVVDDTVHFIYNFQKYYERTANPREAVRETLLGTGRALLITSLVLCTGFFILMFASLNHLVNFGFFTGITILIALVADFFLLPAILLLMNPPRKTLNSGSWRQD